LSYNVILLINMPMSQAEMKKIEREHKRVLKEQKHYYRMLKIQERHNRQMQRELKRKRK
jgi:hypothetical protein